MFPAIQQSFREIASGFGSDVLSLGLRSESRASQPPGAGLSITDFDRVLDQMYGGQPTFTGALVSPQTSLRVSAVWACISALSDDLATLPLLTYRYSPDYSEKSLAPDHYLWSLLQQEANPAMTAFRFKNLLQTWLCLWGNAFAEIEINGRGQVIALWPWRPDRVSVRMLGGGRIEYIYKSTSLGDTFSLPQERVLHLRGMSLDGILGLSPIEYHKQTVGLSMAMTEHGGRYFANGARPLGILEHPNKLGDVAHARLDKSWNEHHRGLTNVYRLAILEEGMKYHEVGANMVDSQYLESQNFTTGDIARIYKVPPHRIGMLDRSTNNNIEHQGLEYVQYSLRPLATNWEQEIEFSLLSPRERQTICVRYNFRNLLRGDMKAMSEFYPAMTNSGTMTNNEVRGDLDMNPLPFRGSNIPWRQGAMLPATGEPADLTAFPSFGKVAGPPTSTPDGKPVPDGQKVNGLAH